MIISERQIQQLISIAHTHLMCCAVNENAEASTALTDFLNEIIRQQSSELNEIKETVE